MSVPTLEAVMTPPELPRVLPPAPANLPSGRTFIPPLSRTAMPRWLATLWYEFAYWMTMAIFTLGFSLRTSGRNRIPRRGPVLLIANHQSFLDPLAIGV